MPASAIYVALYNGAIGLGAMLGAFVLSAVGMSALFLVAGILTGLGLVTLGALDAPETLDVEQ